MAISAGSIPCPPFIDNERVHRRAITEWMMRVSPLVTSSTGANTFVTQDSLSAALATLGGGTEPFLVATDFGAKGDTRRMSTTVGINQGSDQLTAPSASFTADDVGKALTIQWNDSAGAFTSFVLSVNSATSVRLTTNSARSLTAEPAIVTCGTDDYAALQAGINACISQSARTLYIKAGWYTTTNMLSVGGTVSIVGDGWKGLRDVGTSTTRNWADSPAFGTVLFPVFTESSASACFRVSHHSCQIRNLEIESRQPLPGTNWAAQSAPWCIKAYRAPFIQEGGDGLYIENVMMRNPTKGVRFHGVSRGWINGLYGQPSLYGIYNSGNYDVWRAENVHFWPFYSDASAVMATQIAQGDGIVLGRVDNPQLSNLFFFHMRSGIHLFNSNEADINPTGYCQRAQFTNVGCDDCVFGLLIIDNCHASFSNFYTYCYSTSAGAAIPSTGIYAISVNGQAAKLHLELNNVDITGCTGPAMNFDVPATINISNMRLESFNQANAGRQGIILNRSSTCNAINVVDSNNHFSTTLYEALTNTVLFNVQGNEFSGTYRSTGNRAPLAGVGLEMSYSPALSAGFVVAYNRDTSQYADVNLHGKTITFKVGTDGAAVAYFTNIGDLFVPGGLNSLAGLSISGGAVVTGNVLVGTNLTVSADAVIMGGISGRNGLSISGGAVFSGNVLIGTNLSVSANCVVAGGLTTHSGLSVSGGAIISGNVSIGGTLVVNTDHAVAGNTSMGGTLLVTNGITGKNGLSISGGVAMTGVLHIGTVYEFADDAAAATGGLAIGDVYRTGSALKVRVS